MTDPTHEATTAKEIQETINTGNDVHIKDTIVVEPLENSNGYTISKG